MQDDIEIPRYFTLTCRTKRYELVQNLLGSKHDEQAE